MYILSIGVFGCGWDRLSKFDMPGLPNFQEKRQIVSARGDTASGLKTISKVCISRALF